MLFNSYEFILAFLPVTLIGFFLCVRFVSKSFGLTWLTLSSLFFYGWWNPNYLLLIVVSVLVNFGIGWSLGQGPSPAMRGLSRRGVLTLGIIFNLGLLGYFKYTNFFVDNLALLTGSEFNIAQIILPLGISFFTFQQIAYLIDAYRGITKTYSLKDYALFVTFFPQLIAGPIVHPQEMLPQFSDDRRTGLDPDNFAVGVTIFSIGLFKKAILADGIATYATPVFNAAAGGDAPSLLTAWGGALAYTLQLYFDFSGYSDMAIGAARMFGIILPVNFNSPYKATSITEFWRRWHMTLSRFLRDYIYIPLGGNRLGRTRRYGNLMLTMLLGGIWHGAGWTFVVWGLLQGFYLAVDQGWRELTAGSALDRAMPGWLRKGGGWLLTFVAVVVSLVVFRAANLDTAATMLGGMIGLHGVAIPNAIAVQLGGAGAVLQGLGVDFAIGGGSTFVATWLWIAFLLPVALLWPNTQELMCDFRPVLDPPRQGATGALAVPGWLHTSLRWRPTRAWAGTIAVISGGGLLALSEITEFLYFQF